MCAILDFYRMEGPARRSSFRHTDTGSSMTIRAPTLSKIVVDLDNVEQVCTVRFYHLRRGIQTKDGYLELYI